MSKAEKTKQYIIEKTAPLFNKKGYGGTSLSDITNATGLTKGSIYGNFENKDAVALSVYAYNVSLLYKSLELAFDKAVTAKGKLLALTDFYRKYWKDIFEKGGCPLLNGAVEADDDAPFLKQSVQESFHIVTGKIAAIIRNGQRSGEFKVNIDAEEYAHLIWMLIEGGILVSRITNKQNHLFSALDRIEMVIEAEIVH